MHSNGRTTHVINNKHQHKTQRKDSYNRYLKYTHLPLLLWTHHQSKANKDPSLLVPMLTQQSPHHRRDQLYRLSAPCTNQPLACTLQAHTHNRAPPHRGALLRARLYRLSAWCTSQPPTACTFQAHKQTRRREVLPHREEHTHRHAQLSRPSGPISSPLLRAHTFLVCFVIDTSRHQLMRVCICVCIFTLTICMRVAVVIADLCCHA